MEESSVKEPIDKVRTPLEWNREYTSCKAAEATEQDFSNEKLFCVIVVFAAYRGSNR